MAFELITILGLLVFVLLIGRASLAFSRRLDVTNTRLSKIEGLVKQTKESAARVESSNNLQLFPLLPKDEWQFHLSFTSYPARFTKLLPLLESIRAQILKPTKVTLTVSESDFLNMPSSLKQELDSYKIDVLRFADIGPGKKLIPLLASQELPIIVVDDDLILPPDLTLQLMIQHQLFPKAIIASRAHLVSRADSGALLPYAAWEKQVTHVNGPQGNLFATSGAGTLFPQNCLHTDVLDLDSYRQLALHTDDLWWHIHARRKGTLTRRVPGLRDLNFVPETQEHGLWNSGNKERNEENLKLLVERYGDYF
jgi:hypothetical protein